MGRGIQNGLIALGSFIALSYGVKPLVVFIFAILFWTHESKKY